MRMRFTHLMSVLVLAAASSVFASAAIAQEEPTDPVVVPVGSSTPSIPDAFNRAFFRSSGDIYTNGSVRRQLEFFLGFGTSSLNSFPDNEIMRDARRIEILYRNTLEQQVASDPVIRTPDLTNPFGTSMRLLRSNSGVVGSEFIFEPSPRQ